MKRILAAVVVLMVVSSTMAQAQAPAAGTETDPILGTWRLNVERSTGPAPGTINVRRYTLRPDGFMVTLMSGVSANSDPFFLHSTWKYDGNTYPLYTPPSLANFSATGTAPQGGMSYRAEDAYTTRLMPRNAAGEATFEGERSRVVSRDGQTMTDTSRGTNAQGNQVNNVTVWDRVE